MVCSGAGNGSVIRKDDSRSSETSSTDYATRRWGTVTVGVRERFFTISDADYFPGTVALVNSLRLTGHEQGIVVLDRGLTQRQRDTLASCADVVELPPSAPSDSYLVKPYPALLDVDGVVTLIDSDMIVTSSLQPILDHAASGRICAFPNHPSALWRSFPEWLELFELRTTLRKQPYLNAGFVAMSVDRWPTFLQRWWSACTAIPDRLASLDDPEPLAQLDQDALNAILMSEIPEKSVEILPSYEWHLGRVELVDESTLLCVANGTQQPLLHTPRTPKVWQASGWRHVEPSTRTYVTLMPRVLFASDVPIRLMPSDVPLWVRPGRLARISAAVLAAANGTPWVLRKAQRIPHRTVRELRRGARFIRSVVQPGE